MKADPRRMAVVVLEALDLAAPGARVDVLAGYLEIAVQEGAVAALIELVDARRTITERERFPRLERAEAADGRRARTN